MKKASIGDHFFSKLCFFLLLLTFLSSCVGCGLQPKTVSQGISRPKKVYLAKRRFPY